MEKHENPHLTDKKESFTDTGPKIGCRHIQMILLSLALLCGFSTRSSLSVAIVAMTDNTTSPNPDIPTYDWNNTSIILSSFFWSYLSLQIPAAYLGKTYGPKYFLLAGFFINCCACILTPLAADKLGSTGVLLCRVIQGFGQGFLFPSVNVLLGRWAPEQERTTLCTIAFSGASIGSILASVATGYISASWWGWPMSYYILSSMGFCWCLLWLCFGYSSPASHPRISAEEKNYIQTSLMQKTDVNLPIPWKKIFTSVPFYALMIAQLGTVWGFSIMTTETPTYLAKAMNFDVKSSALVSAMPSLVAFISGLSVGRISDWIISKRIVSKLNARKMFQLIGSCGQALCLIWLSFLQPSQASSSIFILGLGNALVSSVAVGSAVNYMDLSPRFSGILYGIINTAVQGICLAGPLSVNWIVTDTTSVSQWQLVYLIAAGFFIVGGTVFFFFASASRQSWDGPKDEKLEERAKKISIVSLMSI